MIASIDGTNNFKDSYTPTLGVVVSRELGRYGAVYVEPMWVNNSNLLPSELVDDNDTFMVGLGARIRVRPTVYLVGEFIPRLGYEPGVNHGTLRHREAGRRPHVPAEFLERLRHDDGPAGARRHRQRRLVSRIQHLEEVLLMARDNDSQRRLRGGPLRSRRLCLWPAAATALGPGPSRWRRRWRRWRRCPTRPRSRSRRPASRRATSPWRPARASRSSTTTSQPHDMNSDPHPDHTDCPEHLAWASSRPAQSGTTQNLNHGSHVRIPRPQSADTNTTCRERFEFSRQLATTSQRPTSAAGWSELPAAATPPSRPASVPARRIPRLDETFELGRRAGQHRKRAPVHRHDLAHAEHRAGASRRRPDPS